MTPAQVHEAARLAMAVFPAPVARLIRGHLSFHAAMNMRFIGPEDHELMQTIYRLHIEKGMP